MQNPTFEDVKTEILRREGRVNPFEWVKKEDVEEVVSKLHSLDPDHWGEEGGRRGARYESLGDEQKARSQNEDSGKSYYWAYEFSRIGRYPVPSSPEKVKCYQATLRNFLKAAKFFDPPLERVEIPFEGRVLIGYLQVPRGTSSPPVVMHWGGVDGWKEDRRSANEAFHQLGLATFNIDMPGTGENPVFAHEEHAERTFSAAMDFLEKRSDIDGTRIAVMGASFGGYWATKLAYVEAKRLRGAVNWGAGVHHTSQPDWLRPALTERAAQYLMGPSSLLESRAYIFRAKSLDEVLQTAPRLSLKTQGLLNGASAPLLLINGKKDDQHPIDDYYLLMEYGSPKDVRIFPEAGHMGRAPGQPNREVLNIVCRWLKQKLTGISAHQS